MTPISDQIQLLRQLISYDPATGALTWRQRTPDMFASGIGRGDADSKGDEDGSDI